jgi:hypothetical protein
VTGGRVGRPTGVKAFAIGTLAAAWVCGAVCTFEVINVPRLVVLVLDCNLIPAALFVWIPTGALLVATRLLTREPSAR